MQDRETGSLWSHITGEALEGEMNGRRLEILPSVQTTWARWFEQHPNTKVLRKEIDIRSSQYESYFKDPSRIGILRSRWLKERMPGKSKVYGISRRPHALAITDEKLNSVMLLNVRVGSAPLVVFKSDDGGVRAYLSKIGSKILHFYRSEKTQRIKDKETGSLWDLNKGICLDGSFKGTVLSEEVVRLAFWFAWSVFYPNTEVLD